MRKIREYRAEPPPAVPLQYVKSGKFSISQEAYSIVHGPDKKNGKLEMLPDRFIS